MKKILLTTTALTLIAGAASAGISLSGSGRMGVVSNTTKAVAAVAPVAGTYTGITTAAGDYKTLNDAVVAANAVTGTAFTVTGIAGFATTATPTTSTELLQLNLDRKAIATARAVSVVTIAGNPAPTVAQQTIDATTLAAYDTALAVYDAVIAKANGTAGTALVPAKTTSGTSHRLRVNINASGETDGGLTFGAFVRLNMNGGALGAIGAPRLWIGNGTATLTIGNAGGAVAQNGNIWNCSQGFTGSCAAMPGAWTWASHSSGGVGNNVVRVDFALGAANLSISGGNTNDTEVAATFALGAAKVGISYDNGTGGKGGTQLGVSFDAGSAKIGLLAARSDNGFNGATVSVGYAIGGGTLNVFGGTGIKSTASAASGTRSIYGVSYSQSLGGGATVAVSARSIGGNTTTDAGVKFSF